MKTRRRRSVRPTVPGNRKTLTIFAALGLGIGLLLGIVLNNPSGSGVKTPAPVEVFTPATLALAREFRCSCGSCGEKNLAICECPAATTTKQFIEMNLNQGLPPAAVIDLVKSIYGHHNS